MRTHCIAGGTLLQALWWPKREENLKESGRTYMSNSFTLLDSRNWHSRVKQPCSDSKKKGKTGGPEQSLWVKVLVVESCLALCDPMDCSPPGFSFRGILHARILEWVAMPSSRGSSQTRDRSCLGSLASPALAGGFFTSWATRETHSCFTMLC